MRKIDLTNFQVASSETARDINRRIALSLIRRLQPISRAELARRSGLQRSTVSAIISQLIEEGWVTEGPSQTVGRGRRPRALHLNVERAGILAVDVQPTQTRIGLAGLDARLRARDSWATPADPQQFAVQLSERVSALRRTHRDVVFEGMGVSLPGRVDEAGRVMFAPNLGWSGIPLKQLLEDAVGMPVVLENAASACALAELWFGGQPDHVRHLAAVTISEGVGVGLLLNGQLIHGHDSMAGEFGHVTIDESGPPCSCGKRGCWEQYASNAAAVRHYQGLSPAAGAESARITTFPELLALASSGNSRALETIDRMAQYIGYGVAALLMGLAPQVLVIVGEITSVWPRVGPIIDDVLSRRALPIVVPTIVPTDPATEPRLRGAVALVVQQHFGAPDVA